MRMPPPVPSLHDLVPLLAQLPPGQRRVAAALVADSRGRTYRNVAAALGVHSGSVYTQLGRIRRRHPAVYAALMALRADQLARRHARVLLRAKTRRAIRRYICQHVYGCEPWER
jgi:IS30 family transposase